MMNAVELAHGSITWHEIDGEGYLVLSWQDGRKELVRWDEPITARTDSWTIANQFTIKCVDTDHDGEYVHVSVEV